MKLFRPKACAKKCIPPKLRGLAKMCDCTKKNARKNKIMLTQPCRIGQQGQHKVSHVVTLSL